MSEENRVPGFEKPPLPEPLPPPSGRGGASFSTEFDIVQFINEISDYVPARVRQAMWGFANRMVGLSKLTPRQASAMIDRAYELALLVKISVPKRKITKQFILDLENFVSFCKFQIYRATIPRNERELLTLQVSEVINTSTPQPQQRKKFLGLF